MRTGIGSVPRSAASLRRRVKHQGPRAVQRRSWLPMLGTPTQGRSPRRRSTCLSRSLRVCRRVVSIGPAHYVPFSGIAIPTSSAFETPLGPVSLDLEHLRDLSAAAAVRTADEPHAPEHALEVELPFLQTVLPRFTLVPLLVGDASPSDVADVLGCFAMGRRRLSWSAPTSRTFTITRRQVAETRGRQR